MSNRRSFPLIDQVIIMTVNPGSLKEKFIDSMLFKISELYKLKERQKMSFDIEVDGNINDKNIISCKESGANFFVSGGYIFKDSHYKKNISDLKNSSFKDIKEKSKEHVLSICYMRKTNKILPTSLNCQARNFQEKMLEPNHLVILLEPIINSILLLNELLLD